MLPLYVKAEWLARGRGELGNLGSGVRVPPVTADFSVIAECPKNTHMLSITLPLAGDLHRRANGNSMSVQSRASL